MNYDECLEENPFFKTIQDSHGDIVKKATEEAWIICIPRIGTFEPAALNTDDILEHVLVPNLDLPNTHFYTLSKREVVIQDKFLAVKEGTPVQILFDETFYINGGQKYTLWCIERPLYNSLPGESVVILRNVHDCLKYLWKKYKEVLDDVNVAIQNYLASEHQFEELGVLKESVLGLYSKSTDLILHKCQDSKDNVNLANLAIESYILHCIHHKLFPAVCSCLWQADAAFNKIHRNLVDLQLKDLEISSDLLDNLSLAKREIVNLNRCSTVLGKTECLRRVVNLVSTNKLPYMTTDDLLKIFVFLVIKSNLNNWISNLMYLKLFQFCSISKADENSFLITTLEAAIEYVKNEIKFSRETSKNLLSTIEDLFLCIQDGNLDAVKEAFNNTESRITNPSSRCHPLCSCDKCEVMTPLTLNSCDDKGCTALHIACLHNQPHIVEYLIKNNVEINVCDSSESTPLHYAALRGSQNAVLLLLHSHAQMDVRNCDGNTPLHLAANNGHENCVKALIYFAEQKDLFVDVNPRNSMGDTAMHLAAKWGYFGIVHILLQYGADVNAVNKREQTVINCAHNDYLRNLLLTSREQFHFPPKLANEQPIRPRNIHQLKKIDLVLKAIANNDLPLMCFYLGIPTFSCSENSTATCHPLCACDSCLRHFQKPEATLKQAESLNVNTCNSEGFSPLHAAAMYGRTEMLRLLLDVGASVNARTNNSQTPLHLACKNQRLQVMRELLQCGGCLLDVQDAWGNIPLHYACLSGNGKSVDILLSHGSDCNVKNHAGKSPLQEAKGKMLYNVVTLMQVKAENGSKTAENVYLFT